MHPWWHEPAKCPKTRFKGFPAWFSGCSKARDKQTPHKKQSKTQSLIRQAHNPIRQGKATPSKASPQNSKQSKPSKPTMASKKQWAKLRPDAKHQKSKALRQALKQKSP